MFGFITCCTKPKIGACDQVLSAAPLAHQTGQEKHEDLEEQLFDDPEDSDHEVPKQIVRASSFASSAGVSDFVITSYSLGTNSAQLLSSPSSDSCFSGDSAVGSVVEEGLCPSAFAGHWKLERVEGDVDAFMASCGTSWAMRRMAKSLNYGVGSTEQQVSVVDNKLTIVNKIGLKKSTSHFTLDGEESETDGLDGSQCVASVDLEKDGFLIRSRRSSGTSLGVVRRYFEGETLVVEATSKKYCKVRRFYSRK
uniref:Uncharacterized protein n=1 Tax=Noctiluca scintillans TaxID=2966 RepID=A0A7S1A4P7_NOCSC|mmetsp:Transcript_30500/g.81214  ORF Transcript_30500/g.81214 Transcript_30500/m.81214 type:complete len:252 (+) Transcript_30500:79-834(+)